MGSGAAISAERQQPYCVSRQPPHATGRGKDSQMNYSLLASIISIVTAVVGIAVAFHVLAEQLFESAKLYFRWQTTLRRLREWQ
jgi:hypothetical protein